MRKVFNFGAGPAMLPEEVLLEAQAELLDWHHTGMSIMEMGHRGAEFQVIADQSEADLRELMGIPKNYYVLFLAGGATTQFAMVPLNLFDHRKKANYFDTGIWSKKAIHEAKRYGDITIAGELTTHHSLVQIEPKEQWSFTSDAAYVHCTLNETIEGVSFSEIPKTGNVPLVADMTSCILSEPIDVSQFGIIYAGTQKNLGQAGLTVVIIRDDLVNEALPHTPTLYQYRTHVEHKSFYNTPPTYAWYITSLVLAWMKRKGGVAVFAEINKRKANKLYSFIDAHSEFYINHIHPNCRSVMNVPFNLKNDILTTAFLEQANKVGLTTLKGHRLAGGVRASIYNSMPEEGVDALISFMENFMKTQG